MIFLPAAGEKKCIFDVLVAFCTCFLLLLVIKRMMNNSDDGNYVQDRVVCINQSCCAELDWCQIQIQIN